MSEGVFETEQDIESHEEVMADMVELSDERISDITEQLEKDDKQLAKLIFTEELNAVNTAELLSKITVEDRKQYLENYPKYIQVETYSHLNEDLMREALEILSPSDIAYILRDLDSDDALDIVTLIEEEKQKEVIKKLSKRTRLVLKEGMSFPEDSAGRLMQREFVSIPQFWTAGKTIDYLRTAKEELPDDFFDIVIISPSYHVLGEVPLNNLVRADRRS